MPNFSTELAIEFTDRGIELLRLSAGLRRELFALLSALERELVARLANEELTAFQGARLRTILADVRGMIAGAFAEMRDVSDAGFAAIVQNELHSWASIVNRAANVTLVNGALPSAALATLTRNIVIQGAPNAEWWARQAGDLAFRFNQQIRLGFVAGETVQQLINRVRGTAGAVAKTRDNLEALVRTGVQTAANAARLAAFRRNGDVIKGVQQVSTLDERTTDICIAYDGQAWDLDGNPLPGTTLPFNEGPPRHWNCRSVLIPVMKTWRDLGVNLDEIPSGTRASMDGQVAAKLTFAEWLKTRSQESQDRILGKGRAELWREGKLSLTGLLDQRGRPLLLETLRHRSSIPA